MAKYRVLWHLKKDDRTYKPGELVELTAEEAKRLHCVEPLPVREEATEAKPGGAEGKGKGPKEQK